MSHRRPPTKADKAVNDLLHRNPELMGIDRVVDAADEGTFELCPSTAMLARFWDEGHVDQRSYDMMARGEMLRPDIIALWSRWRSCRHVYRFDRGLTEALASTDSPDDMPITSLRMLPYPIVFVDAETPHPTIGGGLNESRGFFAWVDDGCMILMHLVDGRYEGVTIDLGKGTLGEAVRLVVWADEQAWGKVHDVGVTDGYRDLVRSSMVTWISHLLYIISDRSEQEVVYRPSGKANPRKASQSTIHDVGVTLGRRLGQASVRYVGGRSGNGTGATVRPHVRSAHWHHFWTGPLGDPDKRRLVVRWLEPIFVGTGETGTVIHES